MVDTFMELKWLSRILHDMGVIILSRINLYGDNKSAQLPLILCSMSELSR